MTQFKWTFDPDNPVYQVEEKRKSLVIQGRKVRAYLWARSILCTSCTGLIPLSPNWRLSPTLGIRLIPDHAFLVVRFEVVDIKSCSWGTVKNGIAVCPLCGSTMRKEYPAEEARSDRMGHINYCEVVQYHYPIYHYRGAPTQGKDPLEFIVPGIAFYQSDCERWRCLRSAGLTAYGVEQDPLLRELGLFGGKESEFAPGVSLL